VLEVVPDGEIRIVAAWENSPVTVGAAAGPDGALYFSQLGPAPYTPGCGRIDRVLPDGTVTERFVPNLTTPIDVAFAPDGTIYVLQYAAQFSPELLRYIPFGGQVLRVMPDGMAEPVVTNLVFPTALTFGPDGALYVSNYGNEGNEGQGQILRVVPGDSPVAGPDVPAPEETGSYSAPEASPVAPASDAPIGGTVNIIEADDAQQWGYDPAVLTIQAGQAVVFTNTGRIAHTATDSGGAFDTGLLQSGESATIMFDKPGTYTYFCQPHPWMKATIVVEGAAATPAPAVAALEAPELDDPTISYWKAALLVGAIVVGLFGAGFVARRKATKPDNA
jgi:plastocyanin